MFRPIFILVLFLLAPLPAFCYIDPGTGSMLFSFITGIAVTLFFFCKNLFIRIKTGDLLGRARVKQDAPHGLVIYSEGKQYWNVFSPVLEELERRGIACVYYSSDEDDPGLARASPLVKTQFIGKGNAAYRFLNFLEAELCLMTTPGLDVLQLKRSPGVKRYAHILHAVVDCGLYKLFSFDYFDILLLTGAHQIKDIRELEEKRGSAKKELIVTGCTYLDVMAEKAAALVRPRAETKTVLVAPSWGLNGILKRYGLTLLTPLARSSYQVIIRPHPQSTLSEKETLARLEEALAPYPNVSWNFDRENLAALSAADVLISDFSGVIFDYIFLFERPVFYAEFEFDPRAYDASDLDGPSWTLETIRKLGHPIDEASFDRIEAVLDQARQTDSPEIKRVREEAYMYAGEAGRRTAGVLSGFLKEGVR
jgi:hypothetical protein